MHPEINDNSVRCSVCIGIRVIPAHKIRQVDAFIFWYSICNVLSLVTQPQHKECHLEKSAISFFLAFDFFPISKNGRFG